MKITIIYDNEVWKKGTKADWGFSCLVEAYGKRILFDTGAKGSILLGNMEKLGIDPVTVEEVFISHDHWDHTDGLPSLLAIRPLKVYVPSSFKSHVKGGEMISIEEPTEIHESIFSTGELVSPVRNEQSLVVKAEQGLVVIAGCSHPGVESILKVASQWGKVHALIGGLHGFQDLELIKDISLICPVHCTEHKLEIRSLYPDRYIVGGVGKTIEI
ncbi:MAG: MBL fold metallo-hydrolase [Thermoplasmata archaeon]|nr:MBL fold metallo-hydrolase [Thermoplasmata archaeon]